jgi:phosphatidylserine/phosphatidylglycerophosphate/cardiolipin synthase-like enzyme
MQSILTQLNDRSLQRLHEAVVTGRLTFPVSSLTLAQLVPQADVSLLFTELVRLQGLGMTADLLSEWLRVLQDERLLARRAQLVPELVMTGPETAGAMLRDTGVVVRQLFANAAESVWVCGFAVYQGREIFQALGARMTEQPDLLVRLLLNIDRPYGDTSSDDHLLARFRQRFAETQWPTGVRLPEVYYDPRSLASDDAGKSACLHAKFVIADGRHMFLSSANFTEAAQQRNIEAGLLIESERLATELSQHFQSLIDEGHLRIVKWYGTGFGGVSSTV